MLLKNPLFKSIDYEYFINYCNGELCQVTIYEKETLIAQEGDICESIGFILSGKVSAQQLSTDGQALTVHSFSANDAFGVAVFGLPESRFPFNLYAHYRTEVMYISFDSIRHLISTTPKFSMNFIQFLSKRIEEFRNKIELLQYKTVRSRLIFYLKTEAKYYNASTFQLRHTKVAISELIGVARPSISRELKHMVEDGLITIKGKQVQLIDTNIFMH
jgi:CRP-like cAMP-binding protein